MNVGFRRLKSSIGRVNLRLIPDGLNAEELEKFLRENGAELTSLGGARISPRKRPCGSMNVVPARKCRRQERQQRMKTIDKRVRRLEDLEICRREQNARPRPAKRNDSILKDSE